MNEKLTSKQQRFVDAYDGNATEAALLAGYSKKTAAFIGAENLKKPKITQAIRKREMRRMEGAIANRQARQEFWTAIMLDDARPMRDRLKASELLARSEGDFLDRIEAVPQSPAFRKTPAEVTEELMRIHGIEAE